MTHRALLGILICSLALCTSIGKARSETIEIPGGFELGSSIEEAKRLAVSAGWDLVPISPDLPGQWKVEGFGESQVSLFVCQGIVASVHHYMLGDLDEFAKIVESLKIARRQFEPSVQIVSFLAGAKRVSNIDVRFPELDGSKVAVQFSSTAGHLGISINHFTNSECK